MSITVSWKDEAKTILYAKLEGDWSLEAFRTSINQGLLMVSSVQHPVYVIGDYTDTPLPPMGIIWEYRYAANSAPPNIILTIAITRNDLIRNLVLLATTLYVRKKLEIAVVKSLDAALALVEQRKASVKNEV